MAYNPGVKLAWYLGSKQWDLVHLVFPSNLAWAVLPMGFTWSLYFAQNECDTL